MCGGRIENKYSDEIENYFSRLIKIGRKSSEDMTEFELQHLSGLFIREGFFLINYDRYIVNRQNINELISSYLISNEEKDANIILKHIKNLAITHFKERINSKFYQLNDQEDRCHEKHKTL